MATRIPRITQVIFGLASGANPGGIGVFGSLAAGSPTESLNLSVIQAAAQWSEGWGSAVINNFPALEDLNSIPYVLSTQIAEILQDGIPPYDSGTTYFTGSFCQVAGVIYVSLIDNNVGNTPTSSPSAWSFFGNLPGIFQNELVPTAIAADTNNYNPTGWNSNIFNLIMSNSAGADKNLTGLKFQANGQIVNISNATPGIGPAGIILKSDSVSSSAGNKFLLPGDADINIPSTGDIDGILVNSVQLYYSAHLGGWILLGKNF